MKRDFYFILDAMSCEPVTFAVCQEGSSTYSYIPCWQVKTIEPAASKQPRMHWASCQTHPDAISNSTSCFLCLKEPWRLNIHPVFLRLVKWCVFNLVSSLRLILNILIWWMAILKTTQLKRQLPELGSSWTPWLLFPQDNKILWCQTRGQSGGC